MMRPLKPILLGCLLLATILPGLAEEKSSVTLQAELNKTGTQPDLVKEELEAITLPSPEEGLLEVDLPEVIRLTAQKNLMVSITEAMIQQQKGMLLSSFGELLPSVEAQYYGEKFDGGTIVFKAKPIDIKRTTHTPRLSMKYDLPLGGKTIFRVSAAHHRLKSSEFARDRKAQEVLYEALESYQDMLLDVTNVELARQSLQEAESLLAFNQQRYEQGFARRLDVVQSKAQKAEQENSLLNAINRSALSKVTLATILNLPVLTDIKPKPTTQLEPIHLMEGTDIKQALVEAEKERPDLKDLEEQIRAARADFRTVRSDLLPTLTFSSYMAGIGPDLGNLKSIHQAGGGMDVNLLKNMGVETLGKMKAAKGKEHELLLRKMQKANEIKQEIMKAYYSYELNRGALTSTQERLLASAEAFEIAKARREAGFGVTMEVKQLQTDLTEARFKHFKTIHDYNLAQFKLLLECGQLTQDYLMDKLPLLAATAKPGSASTASTVSK